MFLLLIGSFSPHLEKDKWNCQFSPHLEKDKFLPFYSILMIVALFIICIDLKPVEINSGEMILQKKTDNCSLGLIETVY